jgi:hypothetical protein
MSAVAFPHPELVRVAKISPPDLARIQQCRHPHTRLGFAYQLAFVRLANRFPAQEPLEMVGEIATYVSVQLDIPTAAIQLYVQQRRTIVNHQQEICDYLQLRRFSESEVAELKAFLFEEACRLEQTGLLLVRAKSFLQENGILFPAESSLRRLIAGQRQQAREHIFRRVMDTLTPELTDRLDALLVAGDSRLTPFQELKQPPGKPSPSAMLRLTNKLEQIQGTRLLGLDLTWLNNNYQRMLARYAHRCSADRLRDLQAEHRYAVLICFLWQVYRDTIDYLVDMHDKLMTGVYARAQENIDEELRKRRQLIHSALATFQTLGNTVLDSCIDDRDLRRTLFTQVDPERLAKQMTSVERLLTGKHSHVLNLVVDRFTYLRQFSPALFIPDAQWATMRAGFFARAGLPTQAEDVPAYLTGRLNQAYDRFLTLLPDNTYARVNENHWQLSADPGEKLDEEGAQRLEVLKGWMAQHLREIKLPALLIEVDNELHFTRHFMLSAQPEPREAEQVCTTLATIMAHGCNIGPYTMARLTEGITYRQIKEVTDWQLTEEAQRQTLAQLVNAISHLDVTQA